MVDISLTLITSKPRSTNPSEMSSAGVAKCKVPYHSLYKRLRFGIEGAVGEVTALEVRADGRKIHCFSRGNSGPVSVAMELEAAFQQALQLPLRLY
jgi:hypothetical protein